MPEEPQPAEPLELFYSYSHKDEELRRELEKHLSLLKRQRVIRDWHGHRISAGTEWAAEVDKHLAGADIVLLLVSADFLASDYCYAVEMKLALEKHEEGLARVIPVILRPCDWKRAPFGALQALPANGTPVTKWADRDEAFLNVVEGIRVVTEELKGPRRNVCVEAIPTGGRALLPRPPVVGFVPRRDGQGRDIVKLLGEELAPGRNRLVALWGPGGVGKSTLAAEFVRATWGPSPARVAWVGALGRPEFGLATLLDEVATQLGREDLRKLAPEAKAVQVAALVSGTPTLVVLDNFETIAGAEQARCLDFLARQVVCPALITTRSRANHEDVYNVPLAAMTLGEAHDLIRRLVGQTRRPSNFDRLDRDDLIRRCEANPLVLHWVVRQIDLAQRPQDVLDDLARGEGDAAERVFTRSFNLPQLGDDGRAALLALSLFTPDASREALAEVAGFGDDVRRLDGAVGSLSSLWLVEATEGNERLFLRGLTRELAKSRLLEGAFAEECGQSYVAHFLGYAGAHGGTTAEDLDALDAERSNLLGALDVAFKMQDWQGVVSLSHALDSFLNLRGYWDEGVECAKKAEAAARALGDEDRAAFFKAYAAMIRVHRGEYEEARKTYQATLEMVRRLGNERAVAACLHQLGGIALAQDRFEEARPLYRACLEIHNRLGDLRSIAVTQHELGRLEQNLGNLEEARRLYQESLESHRRRGDFENVSSTLHQLGTIASSKGEVDEAKRLYLEGLDIAQSLGDQHSIAFALHGLGVLETREGNKTEALRLLREALGIFEKLGAAGREQAYRDLVRAQEILG